MLQIQCNPYQITNVIFHRTKTYNFKICLKTQKTLNSHSNLEKERTDLEESGSFISDYAVKLQSLKQYAIGIDIQIQGVPLIAQWKQIPLRSMRTQVQSLALLSELRIWHCCELWCRSQTRLRSGIAVTAVQASSYSSDSTPNLGILHVLQVQL